MLPGSYHYEVKRIAGRFAIAAECTTGKLLQIASQGFEIQVLDLVFVVEVFKIDEAEIRLETGNELNKLKGSNLSIANELDRERLGSGIEIRIDKSRRSGAR